MFSTRTWLGVGLTTLFVFGMGLPAAFAQVFVLPTGGGVGWVDMAAAMDPETDDVMVAGSGITSMGEFVASSVSYSGTLNKAFGGGLVATDVSGLGAQNWPNACAVDSSGRLLLGGLNTYETGKGRNLVIGNGFGLVRYNTNGTLDKTFNKTGIVQTNFKFNAEIYAIALQSNGDIVAAGGFFTNGSPIVLARYTSIGALDTTFASGGTVSTALPVQASHVYGVELQSDGSIVVGAQFFPASGPRSMALIRYTSSGRLDTSFGSNGIATFTIGGQSTYLNDIIVDEDDNIVVAGDCGGDLIVARFTPDGVPDTTFGNGGYISGSYGSTACSVALQSNGQIVISGVASNGNLLVARFDPDGELDTSFGPNGQGYDDSLPYSPEEIQHSVLIQSTGQIVIVGWNDTENVVIRYTSAGTPDTTF